MGLGRTVVSDEEDEIGEEDMREVADGDAVDGDRDEDDDEEDDEEGQDEYEKDGFIVDEVDEDDQDDEEERASSDEEKQKKKKRKKRESEKNYVLDEDDYELLQDNNVGGFQRPKPGSKKFKRLKKAGRDSEQDHSGFSDDEILDKTGRSGRTAEEKLKRSLFGDEEGPGAHLEDIGDEEDPVVEEDDIDEDNEMADFIVSSPERDENGAPVRRRKASKKKQRQTPGVSSSALQEAHDIFGDVDELLMMRKKGLAKGARLDDSGDLKEKRLEDEFEPFILKEKYMTEKDDRIRDIDVPERIQVLEESTGPAPVDPVSIEDESGWILSQLSANMDSLFGNKFFAGLTDEERLEQTKRTKEDIVRLLDMMHVQKLDIPFIAMYRRELCSTLLNVADQEETPEAGNEDKDTRKLKWHKVLWAIKDLDRKWLLLQKRKNALQLYYNKRFEEESRNIYDETRLNLNRQLFESISDSLKNAESEREVDDVDSKFNLHFPPGEVGVEEGQFKRPKRKSHYSTCHKAGLWEMATKIGYSSEQFGLLLTLEKMRIEELEDAKEIPEEIAATYTCAMFETPQEVLKGARHMAAVEISCEPRVRKHVRNIFMEHAVVSTKPTPEGNGVIDSFHQFAGIKWLSEKPLTKFEDAQWLLIQKAEEEKLLQVTIKLPENNLNQLMGDCNDNYLSDGVSKPAKLWNDQRKLILQDTFSNFLLPSMEKEARSVLTARAKNWLLMEYGKHLWDKVSVAPWQRKETDNVSDEEVAPRVMACCWGPGKPATTFVMLDSSGEVLDVLYTGSLTSRSQNVNDQQRKKNDESRVLKFIIDHQPHVAVLGAVNLNCTRLKEELFEIIFKMIEEYPREIGHEMEDLPVVYADESLPRLYENSRISSDQLPGQPGIVKRAVALGRFIQNPLAMVATLCGPAREILSWKLGSLEHFLSPDEKYDMIEQVMVDVTNQVGIDINLAASHEWLFSPLQFVSGLGPRKAASLQRALVRTGAITTRKDLTSKASLKKRVFINAAGFLRVRRSGLATNSSQIIDLLDDTRIHPESYELAKTMAKDVFDEDPQDDNDPDEDAQEMAIEHVREKPNYLKALDINAYAQDVEKRFSAINKKETLFDIKMELLNGFRDWRNPYREPDQTEEFYMISGESEDTLAEGRIVQVTVRRVQPQRAICVLESGLTGLVMSEDYSDTNRQVDMTEEISEGDILTCKIRSIQTNRYQVYLTCKESELKRDRYDTSENRDSYYKPDESNVQSEQEKARKEKDAKKYLKSRMIVHPRFQNITADEAIEFLSDKEAGESIIRPSSRGPAFLTLTLKVYDGIYAHKDIVEGGKDHKDITSWLRLGKTLKIGDDTFEDLDEVMDRYVDPLVAHLKSMLSYRKFKRGTKAEVDDLLRIEKTDYPMRIVYCFGISHEHPGTFILSYIRSTNPHHEYIGLYPKGFKFRKRTFEDIDRLVAYFQKHIDDMQHDSGPSIRSVAAMVPMKSPANGGSSGGGGWGGSTTNSNDGGGGWGGGQSDWDKERSSTPGSRTGRNDYRSGGGRDGHPSGLPRPYGGSGGGGGGRGRGRGSYNGGGRGNNNNNERRDTGYNNSSKWGSSGSKDGGEEGWNSFPGAKVQNSPGREAFPGGWSGGGGGNFPGDKVQNSPGREAFPGGWGSTGSGSGGVGGTSGAGWGEDKGSSGGGGGGDGGWGSASKGGGDSTPGNLGWGGGGSSSKKDDSGKGWSDGGGGW